MRSSKPKPLPRWLSIQILQAIGGLLFFFIPCFSYIAFTFVVSGFVPSMRLKPVSDIVAIVAALIYVTMLGPSMLRELLLYWKAKKWQKAIRSAFLLAFAPLMGWSLTQAFFEGPASYILHRAQSTTMVNTELTVVYADDLGGRQCRNRAVLNHEHFFWRREVCGISEAAVAKLRRGGRISVQGTVTDYGMQINRYTYDGA